MRRFVSLPFKIMSLIMAFLLIASVSMTLLWISKTDKDYLSQQQLLREQDQKQFQLIKEMLRARIESWFESFVHFQDDNANTLNAIASLINNEFEYLKINWQINNVWLLDKQGKVLFSTIDTTPAFIKTDTNRVLHAQMPLSYVRCVSECQQFITMPILINNAQVYALTISSSLLEAMAALNQTTLADLAIVSAHQASQGRARDLSINPPISLANKAFFQNLLQKIPSPIFVQSLVDSGYRITVDNSDFLLNLIPINSNIDDSLYLLTVHNINEASQAHRAYRGQIILISILVVVLCASAILILSLQFRQRLLVVTKMLPLLAEKKYVEFHQQKILNNHYFSDEIELLQNTAILLGYQLENLDHTIAQNTRELENMALYDQLTGLPNRNMLNQRLSELIPCIDKQQTRLIVMFLDFDKFRKINDSYGHDMGDEFLMQAARNIQKCLLQSELLFRLSGDEFVIVFNDPIADPQAKMLAENLIQQFHLPIKVGTRQFYSTCSIGIAHTNDPNKNIHELIRQSDMAMYYSKDSGGNRVYEFNDDMYNDTLKRVEIEHEVRAALKGEEFSFALQPQVDIKTMKLIGFEALIRWNHPQKGRISPDEFIPIIENSESMINLGYWGLQQAFNILKELDQIGMHNLKVAVNLSASQFLDPLLIPFLKEQLVIHSRNASQLELELTEQTVVADIQQTLETMHTLKLLGFSFSIDDFGTGYSSLSYLRQMPVEVIKIDRSFISTMQDNNAEMKIVASTIEMINKLGMQVIAEGIETEQQLHSLKAMHCDIGQGYFISKPIDETELYAILPNKVKNGIWLP